MSRTLKTDVPGIDRRVDFDEARKRGLPALFCGDVAQPLPLVVEIGFGRGEFLLGMAQREPEQAFVGVEYSYKRALKMARRLARLEIANVRLVEARAEDLVRDVLTDASVATFWVNFPDPWPKKRHFRRRLFQPGLVSRLADRLVPGGRLEVATDHRDYAEWIDEILRDEPKLANRNAPDPWRSTPPDDRTPTAYELEWRALGRDFHFFSYERSAAASA
jgi:tRNA (guanine-N7-)-methyltransferase